MKERELREAADCRVCGRKIGEAGLPLFYRIRAQLFGLDAAAVQRKQGLGMMIGGALAMVMGPDDDLAKEIGEAETFTVCFDCGTKETEVARLHEIGQAEGDDDR